MNTLETVDQHGRGPPVDEWGPLLEADVTAGSGTPEQKAWNLGRPVTLIGFSKHAHIRLEGLGVEAVHAALLNTGDAIVLADLVSRQGVFCGNQRIRTRIMQPGESFRLGTCRLQLVVAAGFSARDREGLDASVVLKLPEAVQLHTTHGGTEDWTVEAVGTVIGSRPGCDVRLASKEVLPLQAILTRVGRQAVLASLVADKPIRVNGTPASVSAIQSGDTLTIWPVTLRMTIGQPGTAGLETDETRRVDMQEQQDMANGQKTQPTSAKVNRIAELETASPGQPDTQATGETMGPAGEIGSLPPAPMGEIPDLGSRLIQMEEQLISSSKQLRQWQAQLEQYANGLIRRDAELSKRSTQLDELQGWLTQSEGQVKTRSEELDKAHAELQAQRAKLDTETTSKGEQLTQRSEQLDAMQGQLKQLEVKLQQQSQELSKARDEVASQRQQVESQRSSLAQETEALAKTREQLSEQQRQCQADRESLQQQHSELEQEHNSLQEQIHEFEAQQEQLQAELQEFEARRQKLNEQAEQVEQAKAQLQDLEQKLLAEQQALTQHEAQLVERSQVINRFGQVLADAWVHFGGMIEESTKEEPSCETLDLRRTLERMKAPPEPPTAGHRLKEQAATEPEAVETAEETAEPEALAPVVPVEEPAAAPIEEIPEPEPEPEVEEPVEPPPAAKAPAAAPKAAGTPLEQVEPEIREQVKMLRRMGNNKSDEELIAIIRARKTDKGGDDKKKRGWW